MLETAFYTHVHLAFLMLWVSLFIFVAFFVYVHALLNQILPNSQLLKNLLMVPRIIEFLVMMCSFFMIV